MERHILGRPIYIDISYSMEFMEPGRAGLILREHPEDRLLFGTDSPWGDQAETLAALSRIELDEGRRSALLFENAERLLGLT